jgi:hypothetical protein
VFENCLKEFRLINRDDPATTLVAKAIIEAAKQGERDPDRLRQIVLKMSPQGAMVCHSAYQFQPPRITARCLDGEVHRRQVYLMIEKVQSPTVPRRTESPAGRDGGASRMPLWTEEFEEGNSTTV